jgi:hypothetical protein
MGETGFDIEVARKQLDKIANTEDYMDDDDAIRDGEILLGIALGFEREFDRVSTEYSELQSWVAASAGLKCPNCNDSGGYPRQISEDEVVEEQCEFCWVVEDSIFNRNRDSGSQDS